jgi:hypothetical protein
MRSQAYTAFRQYLATIKQTGIGTVRIDFQFGAELHDACNECLLQGINFSVNGPTLTMRGAL